MRVPRASTGLCLPADRTQRSAHTQHRSCVLTPFFSIFTLLVVHPRGDGPSPRRYALQRSNWQRMGSCAACERAAHSYLTQHLLRAPPPRARDPPLPLLAEPSARRPAAWQSRAWVQLCQ